MKMAVSDEELVKAIQELFQCKDVVLSDVNESRIASNMRQAVVKLDEEITHNVHMKQCIHGTETASINQLLKIYDREVFVYSELLPMLFKFQKRNQKSFSEKLNIKSLFLKYFGSVRPHAEDIVLLFERFSSDDYFVTAPENFFTLQQVHYCMEKIAMFHATSYAMTVKEKIDWKNHHPFLHDVFFHPDTNQISKSFLIGSFTNNLKVLCAIKEETQKRNCLVKDCILSFSSLPFSVLERMKNITPHLCDILYKTLDCPNELAIVTHGDFHMWNIAFSNCGKMDVKFFDFQVTRVTSGLVDVHHLLSQVCTPSTRNNHLYEFLETYYTAFRDMCLHLGVDEKDISYTKETINKEYTLRSPWGFAFGFCFVLPRFLSTKQLSTDFYLELEKINESSEIVDLISKRCSPNIWSILDSYVDMVQMEEDLGTLEIMEKLAHS